MSEGSEGRAFPVSYVEFLDPEFTGALDTAVTYFGVQEAAASQSYSILRRNALSVIADDPQGQ